MLLDLIEGSVGWRERGTAGHMLPARRGHQRLQFVSSGDYPIPFDRAYN